MNQFLVTGIAKKKSRHQLGSTSCYNKYQTNKDCQTIRLTFDLPGKLHAVKFIIKHSLQGEDYLFK